MYILHIKQELSDNVNHVKTANTSEATEAYMRKLTELLCPHLNVEVPSALCETELCVIMGH